MIEKIVTFGLGALAGAAGAWAYRRWIGPAGATHGLGLVPSRLAGRILPNPATGSPAPPGAMPHAGYATEPTYEWGYRVGPGDSSGSIAEAVTGEDARYMELLLANPSLPKIGEPGVYSGEEAWDFAPAGFGPGTEVLFPVAWHRYVDQTGAPRGRAVPFPKDPRGLFVDAGGAPGGPALAMAATAGGAAPYGVPFAEAA